MPYTKFNNPWEDSPSTDTPITAEALDHIEEGISDAQALGEGVLSGLNDHVSDTSAAHAASAISAVDEFANSSSTNVQDVLDDLDTAISANGTFISAVDTALSGHLADTADAHDASAISVAAAGFNGNLDPTDDTVQKVAQKVDDLVLGGGAAAAGVTLIDGKRSEPVEMADPPTVTISAAGAATTITGSARIAPNHAAFTHPGVRMASAGTISGFTNCLQAAGPDVAPSGVPYYYLRPEFCTDADKFEIIVQAKPSGIAGSPATFRVLVDGEFVDATPMGPLTTGDGIYRILVDFGSSASREIIFEAQYMKFIGVQQHPKYSIWRSTRDTGLDVFAAGDSMIPGGCSTDGTFATVDEESFVWDGFAVRAGRELNCTVYPSGVGSTGYYFDGGFGTAFVNRIDTDVLPYAWDEVWVFVGLNDRSQTLSNVQTAVNNSYAALAGATNADGLPSVVRAFAPICTMPAHLTALSTIAGYVLTAALANGAEYYGGPNGYIFGSGHVGAPAGDGPADLYKSADTIHLKKVGYNWLARRIAAEISADVRAHRIRRQSGAATSGGGGGGALALRATKSGTSTSLTSWANAIAFNVNAFADFPGHSTTVNPERFVADEDGRYRLTIQADLENLTGNYAVWFRIDKNGAGTYLSDVLVPVVNAGTFGVGTAQDQVTTGWIDLEEGDYLVGWTFTEDTSQTLIHAKCWAVFEKQA